MGSAAAAQIVRIERSRYCGISIVEGRWSYSGAIAEIGLPIRVEGMSWSFRVAACGRAELSAQGSGVS
jgi:hypothetical protein